MIYQQLAAFDVGVSGSLFVKHVPLVAFRRIVGVSDILDIHVPVLLPGSLDFPGDLDRIPLGREDEVYIFQSDVARFRLGEVSHELTPEPGTRQSTHDRRSTPGARKEGSSP